MQIEPSANDFERPVFIVGCPRSGNTLMRMMLNRHSQLAIPGETWFMPFLERQRIYNETASTAWRQAVADYIYGFATFAELGITKDELATELATTDLKDSLAVLSCANRAFARKEGKSRWGDKTPGYVRHLPFVARHFPRATVIHMIRDGRDAALSILENPSVGPDTDSLLEVARYWVHHLQLGRKLGPRLFGQSYMEVRYEDLIDNPPHVLRRVCQVAGLPWEDGLLDHQEDAGKFLLAEHNWHEQARKPVTKDRSGRWRKKMSAHDQCLFQWAAGSMLKACGYEKSPARSWSAAREWARFRIGQAARQTKLTAKRAGHRLLQQLHLRARAEPDLSGTILGLSQTTSHPHSHIERARA